MNKNDKNNRTDSPTVATVWCCVLVLQREDSAAVLVCKPDVYPLGEIKQTHMHTIAN